MHDIPAESKRRAIGSFRWFGGSSAIGIALVYLALCSVFAVMSPRFLTASNFSIIIGQTSAVTIASFAMTMVILSGGIDLSVGAILALSGVVLAVLLQNNVPLFAAVVVALLAAAAVGLLNGLVTVRWKVQPFLVTLGTLSIARGCAEVLANGGTVPILNTRFIDFFSGFVGPVPIPAFWTAGFLVLSWIVLRHTLFGRRLYAIGGNEQAAIQAGTRVDHVKVGVYLISGLFAGVASMIATARLSAGLPGAGVGFELDVIAAVVLGGTGFRGEGGSVVGTLIGALIIGTVSNGLTLMGVDPLVQKIVKGGIILAAIIFEFGAPQATDAAEMSEDRPVPVFEATGLKKSYGSVAALLSGDLSVAPGEVHALLGENGAGKSTFIRIAAGLVGPDAGRIMLDGRPWEPSGPLNAIESGVRVVSQEFSLAPNISVMENLCLGSPRFLGRFARVGQFPWRAARAWASERIAATGLDIDPDAKVADLSVSQRQLVALIRGTLDEPRIVFMDEPSSALDQAAIQALYKLVRSMREQGTAVVYVSHKLEEVFDLTDRLTILRDGATVSRGSPTKMASVDGVIATMVGRQITQLFPARGAERPGRVVLEVEGLHAPQVHGVDLTVRAGEILGIGGLVGAGRTELAKAIAGLAPIAAGSIAIEGRPVEIASRRDAMTNGIEYVTEDRLAEGLVVNRPISENVTARILGRFRRGPFIDHAAIRSFTAKQIRDFSIVAPHGDVNVDTLSGGNQQKTLLASALASDPRIVFFDEPTRGIDVGAKAQIYAMIRELSKNRAIVLISAEVIELLGLADRIVIMKAGRIAGEFDPMTASEEDLVAASLGRDERKISASMQEAS